MRKSADNKLFSAFLKSLDRHERDGFNYYIIDVEFMTEEEARHHWEYTTGVNSNSKQTMTNDPTTKGLTNGDEGAESFDEL